MRPIENTSDAAWDLIGPASSTASSMGFEKPKSDESRKGDVERQRGDENATSPLCK
jgi:hypothetical protein